MRKESQVKGAESAEFDFEYYSELDRPDSELREEAEFRLRELASGHSDMIGAAVAIEMLAGGGTTYLYQARVVAYIRPDNIAAVAKAETTTAALSEALKAVERQVRERRNKFQEPWKQP
jgi:ribosome-associated translation inhibitor RaiA